jgi:hypothetical protein
MLTQSLKLSLVSFNQAAERCKTRYTYSRACNERRQNNDTNSTRIEVQCTLFAYLELNHEIFNQICHVYNTHHLDVLLGLKQYNEAGEFDLHQTLKT